MNFEGGLTLVAHQFLTRKFAPKVICSVGCGMSLQPPRKLALALGGGGVRGAAHLGVLRALQQADLEIAAIAGSSSGALAGMMFALETAGFKREDKHPVRNATPSNHAREPRFTD